MSIYRGAGGAGDAVADSSSEALLIRELVGEAQVSATSAATSATAAGNSETAAATSASNAATSATNAETAETNAELAETGALAAQAAAEAAQLAAETAQIAAELAETNAETAQAAAEAAQLAAETAQTAAELAETNAETAETNAETAETNATASASAASGSASAAATSATNASNSASAASTSATNASNSASAASTSASNAATSETNASTSASTATTQAGIATTQAGLASTSASNAATSETNAAASASTATTQATNASNSATAAATSASNAATSETNAANSATAAQTAETNAELAETNAETAQAAAEAAQLAAETAQTAAELAETNAETAETNAAASASAAATSESNAATSASNAATSETNAATSETNAATSASAAATAESNAAASAAAAAASYDNFDDRYLGAKSAAPTLDNDGDALITGALYYNNGTVTPADKGMYVYDGSVWIAASAASEAILTVFRYTATAGQTTFTGADDNSLTLTYTAGSVIITVNGAVMEVGTDVTASNGTSIVLTNASNVGDEVNIYAFATFNVANTYTQAEADARFFNVTGDSISGNLAFTGTGNRIRGDFSNGTVANRVLFQTSTANTGTEIGLLPNGTGNYGNLNLYNGSDPLNNSIGRLSMQSSEFRILSANVGTGTALPMTFYTGGSERLRIDTSGNVNIGNSGTIVGAKTSIYGNATVNTSSLLSSTGTLALSSLANGVANRCGIYMQTYDASNNPTAGTIHIAPTATSFRGDFISTYMADGAGGSYIVNQYVPNSSSTVERMRINSAGQIGINIVPETQLDVKVPNSGNCLRISNVSGTANYNAVLFYNNGISSLAGYINVSGSTTSYVTSSDYRLKENIEPMTGALAKVSALKPVTYKWKADGSGGQGFIAHELQEVVPDCVTGEKDAVDAEGNPVYQGIDTSFLVATLTAAIQELKADLDSTKTLLADAISTVDAQAARIAALEGTV